MNKELVALDNISITRDYKTILKDVNLNIDTGEIIGVIGDNGLGKTTLLQIIATILQPTSGTITRHNTRISYVPRNDEFASWMYVKDALFFYDSYYSNFNILQAKELLTESGISFHNKIHKLSRGQQQRLFLILSICQDAQLYLMDEAFSGIDPYFKKDIRQFLLRNIPDNSTIIIATHLLRELEQAFDHVIIVSTSGGNTT